MSEKQLQIAIDGPASAGKSTVAKIVAKKLGYIYCDTGAMYRAITYLALEQGLNLADETALVTALKTVKIGFTYQDNEQHVWLDQEDVTLAIRQPEVTAAVSEVSAHAEVRAELVRRQQEIAGEGGIVMDGRDIGTTVLPQAEVKVFLIASVEERAERRYKENLEKGIPCTLAGLQADIAKRDHLDSTREVSPLVKASDAVELDTTGLTIDEVVAAISQMVTKKEVKSPF